MISFDDALAKVNKYLDGDDFPVVITMVDRFTEGWVFCFQSKEYLESGDASALLVGNGPLIVDKDSGEIHSFGSIYPVEKYVKDYAEKKKKSG